MKLTPFQEAQNAARLIQIVGGAPSTFSVAVRQLIADQEAGLTSLSETSEFQVGRLLRGPTALAALYYAGKTFVPEQMRPGWLYTPLQIARMFSPSTLSVILGLTYLFKRTRRIVHPEEWSFIAEPLQKNTEILTLLGASFPGVGTTAAMLGGAMPFFAFAMFSIADRKGYAEYRRSLKIRKLLFDPEWEREQWGCTSIHVGSTLMLSMGFGTKLSHQFYEGFVRRDFPYVSPELRKNPFFTVRCWYDEPLVRAGGTRTIVSPRENLNPAPDLNAVLKHISTNGSLFHWLERRGNDISPDKTPDLLPDVHVEEQSIAQLF